MITAHHLVFGRKAIVKNEGLILDLPFQNSFVDATGKNTMVAGGDSNLPTFTLEGGEYAATFNGSQSLKTNADFVIGTDKVSISFWMKTSQTDLAVVSETSTAAPYGNNAFGVYFNNLLANRIEIVDNQLGLNVGDSATNINDNNWHHVVLIIDRSLGTSQNKIYVDGILSYVQNTSHQSNLNGNW